MDKREHKRRQREHWYHPTRHGQLTPKKVVEHRDTGKDLTTNVKEVPARIRPNLGGYTDYLREWGVNNSNRRYDE